MSKNKQDSIPLLSFFSGGGFMDMGFVQAGFEVIWTNEFDETFAKLHAAGMTSWIKSNGKTTTTEIFNTKSITEINSKDIIKEAFPNGKPEKFGVIGGPPCQDFSMNGSMKGFKGDRGKLTIVYFDKIIDLKPTFFVMENVTGLVKRKESKNFLFMLLTRLEKYYYIDFEVLNSLNFGVPQHRERVFFVGIRKDCIRREVIEKAPFGKWFPFPIDSKFHNSAKKYTWGKKVSFGKKLTKPRGVPFQLCVESCLVPQSKWTKIPNANEILSLYKPVNELKKIAEGETTRPSFKRLHRFRYSPTACYGNNEVHLHPYEHRRISVREALRIQGVPDSYVLPDNISLSKKFKMIGNGVPVPLANSVATALFSFLNQKILD